VEIELSLSYRAGSNLSQSMQSIRIWWRSYRVALCSLQSAMTRVLLGKEALETLIAALHELPTKTAAISSLYHFDSVPQVEIARRLAMPISTVEKHLSRANVYLLERLGGAQ